MFVRLVYESFRRQKRRKLLAGAAITLGVTVATAMIAVATDIGDKINRELRTIGANLIITPQEDTLDVEIGGVNLKPPSDGAFLNEADLPKIKGTFWHNNITGFSPMLPVNVNLQHDGKTENLTLLGTYFAKPISFGKEEFRTGVRSTHPWWKVSGAWPDDFSRDVLLGERLAARLSFKDGDSVGLSGRELRVSGILSTGGAEDDEVVAPIAVAQEIIGKPGAVRRVYVSALTKPEDAFARRDPRSMSGAIYDRWYCSPYPQSIAFQLQEAIPHSHAEQIRQVAQNEGAVLTRIEGLIFLVTLAALFASALAVSAAMATAIFERRAEVGLMKALGAGRLAVASVFFAEATLLALLGGFVGFVAGGALAHQIGRSIFNSQITIAPVLFPVILVIAVIVTFVGSAAAIRKAVELDPVFALRGEL
ncbi:MAG: putative transport system permease protein [Acidobacteriaceae bacterium]|jgi:putative ABC transport system permease protein|nr:putative transport system permease protein [Acidobacteriaceae bacterium]